MAPPEIVEDGVDVDVDDESGKECAREEGEIVVASNNSSSSSAGAVDDGATTAMRHDDADDAANDDVLVLLDPHAEAITVSAVIDGLRGILFR